MTDQRARLSRRSRRIRNHAALGAASVGASVVVFAAVRSDDPIFRASIATAYVALALLAITLGFGPVAALRGKRYPVSTDIRRDVGIWAGVVAVTHVIVGLQVHLRGKMWEYFARSVKGVVLPRIDPFGAANYTGLVAALLLIALLATSNDASLRRLGARRWQGLHATIEWALILTLLHGAAYQWIEQRTAGVVLLFLAVASGVIVLRVGASRRRPPK